jgi:WD40 repeat protein
MLAVIHGLKGRIKFFQVGSWTLSGSLATFREEPPPMSAVALGDLAFNPDGAMIAAGQGGGGSWWTRPKLFGSGEFTRVDDVLRVYRVSDGSLVAFLDSFPGGLHRSGLVWSPNGEYLAFQDAVGDIRFWNPFRSDHSVAVARKVGGYSTLPSFHSSLLFSRDGSQLASNFPDGVRIFDVVLPH